jgi:hypothetical protein
MQPIKKSRNKTDHQQQAGILARFIISAFFGGFMSFIVFWVIYEIMIYMYNDFLSAYIIRILIHALWVVPIFWGILGIFFFETMLSIASKIFESFLDSFSWPNK